uniref:PTB domain-containing protein n=1 Tax=Salarias fasciatus TaxID=181472 RepID=A0A672IS65_SALFA
MKCPQRCQVCPDPAGSPSTVRQLPCLATFQAYSVIRMTAIYMFIFDHSTVQRKDYATSINQMMDKFQYRVEHLFTCDLDGRELRNIIDCVERLKLLDQLGRVWGQDMLLEVHDTSLLLIDIETKEELESVALGDVQGLKAVLNTGVFNSLLTVSVQPRRKRTTTVFMFQCDDVRVRANAWRWSEDVESNVLTFFTGYFESDVK